jgi:cell wall-associated NlpC family hydrolase
VAIRLSRRIRLTVSLAALLAALAALLPPLAFATPKTPNTPTTVEGVQKELTALARKNAQLVEVYNRARIDVAAKQKALAAAKVAAQQADVAFTQARDAISATVAAQYESGSFSTAGALLSSSSGQSYLDQIQALDMISQHNAQVAKQLDMAKTAADTANKTAAGLLQAATQRRDQLAAQKASIDGQLAKYSALLASLSVTQRAAYTNTIAPVPSAATVAFTRASLTAANVPGAAKKAVDFALAQLGKAYVYGAAGPDAFDCSGLTMAAYASAGISLPHSAADQYNYGTHISYSSVSDLIGKLQPGDLIFYYSPIGHVTIYVGGGMMVSASTEGVPVEEVPVANWDASSITGATRIVG